MQAARMKNLHDGVSPAVYTHGSTRRKPDPRAEVPPMARVMIACPSTKQLLYTGASTDRASFNDPGAALGSGSTYCPQCRQPHVWDGKDAVLEAGD